MIVDPRDAVATPSQTVGPFFHFGLTTDETLGRLAASGASGERIDLRIRVLDGDGVPVPDAMIELWQADAEGRYVEPPARDGRTPRPAFTGYGRLPTDADGACTFETIRPGRVADDRGGLQAAHINVCLFARGLLRQLHTRIYFAGDPALDEDAVLRMVPADRRATLLARHAGGASWTIDLRMQGDDETVFLDL